MKKMSRFVAAYRAKEASLGDYLGPVGQLGPGGVAGPGIRRRPVVNSMIGFPRVRGDRPHVLDTKTSLEILSELPELIRITRLVESHDDLKGKEHVARIHRMYVPVMFADNPNNVYKVKLTVKELDGTFEGTVEGVYRAYDARVTEKSARNRYRDVPLAGPSNGQPGSGRFSVILEDLLDGVKDSEGKFYLQDDGGAYNQGVAQMDADYMAAVEAGDMGSPA